MEVGTLPETLPARPPKPAFFCQLGNSGVSGGQVCGLKTGVQFGDSCESAVLTGALHSPRWSQNGRKCSLLEASAWLTSEPMIPGLLCFLRLEEMNLRIHPRFH